MVILLAPDLDRSNASPSAVPCAGDVSSGSAAKEGAPTTKGDR